MHSKQVMTPHVTVVSPATAISEIARKMRDEDIGVTLVVEQERLIGVVAHGVMLVTSSSLPSSSQIVRKIA